MSVIAPQINTMVIIKKAFTLMEIMIVIAIIGILVAISLPNYGKMKDASLGKEANLTLKLIQDAEQFYHIEHEAYLSCSNSTAINSGLKLYIPTGSPNWNYTVSVNGDTFVAMAQRSGGNTTYCINQSSEDTYACE